MYNQRVRALCRCFWVLLNRINLADKIQIQGTGANCCFGKDAFGRCWCRYWFLCLGYPRSQYFVGWMVNPDPMQTKSEDSTVKQHNFWMLFDILRHKGWAIIHNRHVSMFSSLIKFPTAKMSWVRVLLPQLILRWYRLLLSSLTAFVIADDCCCQACSIQITTPQFQNLLGHHIRIHARQIKASQTQVTCEAWRFP